ncbi:hypothetical protein CFAM422_002688 [Trichoderma lentiforme]|uniref:Uncharacterized protein n=1 Tax=Trichoderma lentiforme TaxID=1567552 RepID=A0A9P4XMJ9_9HYPO|nr:hypothetical protein CFAM422_002688 [Trichoderma lentiforme]
MALADELLGLLRRPEGAGPATSTPQRVYRLASDISGDRILHLYPTFALSHSNQRRGDERTVTGPHV